MAGGAHRRIRRRFLDIPPEVVRITIHVNQKCFVLKDPSTERLSHKFVLVANIEAADGGAAIAAGNGRVVQARLSDAKFFWETDLKVKLEDRLEKLNQIVFHEKLGTQGERAKRLEGLARYIALYTGADEALAARAALLAKADLTSEMVGEFPELQGVMGRYYALAQGEDASVAEAIEDHYKPQGRSDRVPASPVAISVGLADKLDTLTGFFAIDEKPTGSKDPYGLRRAALGVIALILENKLRFRLRWLFDKAFEQAAYSKESEPELLFSELMSFFSDRLKVYLRERGTRHDLIDAVFALPGQDDLLLFVSRVEALQRFLDTDDGKIFSRAIAAPPILCAPRKRTTGRAPSTAPAIPGFFKTWQKSNSGRKFKMSAPISKHICSSPKEMLAGRNARDKRLLKMR